MLHSLAIVIQLYFGWFSIDQALLVAKEISLFFNLLGPRKQICSLQSMYKLSCTNIVFCAMYIDTGTGYTASLYSVQHTKYHTENSATSLQTVQELLKNLAI